MKPQRIHRVVAVLVAGAMFLASAAPLSSQAHCAGLVAPLADHHDEHQHGNNSDALPTSGCPHCPPAECALQPACSSPVTGLFATATGVPEPDNGLSRHEFVRSLIRAGGREPPTPPPQRRVAQPHPIA